MGQHLLKCEKKTAKLVEVMTDADSLYHSMGICTEQYQDVFTDHDYAWISDWVMKHMKFS